MLICSVGYAQTKPKSEKAKTKKAAKSKPLVIPNPFPKQAYTDDSLMYMPDPMDTVELKKSPNALTSRVKYDARDSIIYDAITRTIYLYGDAKTSFDDMSLNAELIKIEIDKTLITSYGVEDSAGNVKGKPLFKQGQTDYKADIIKYNYATKKGFLSEFRTKEGEGYIHGENVKKDEDNNFGIRNAKYTTCENEHPHYYIGATRIKVVPEKKVVTGPAQLWIEDVPTPLTLPFGIFSIKRGQSSGVVVPNYGNSLDRGYFLRDGGYYFGLGEKADLRLTGDIYTNLSWAARSVFRYNNRYHYNGSLNLSYHNNKFFDDEDPRSYVSKDYEIRWLHNADPKSRPNTTFSANVNIVSVNRNGNSFFANNSYNAQNIVTNQLQSSISYYKGFKNGKYNLSMNGRMAQNTQTRDITISLPDVTFTIPSFAPFKPKHKNTADKWYENITMNYTMQFRNDLNAKDSILFRSWKLNDFAKFYDSTGRYGMRHDLPIQTSFKVLKFYTLSAGVNLQEYWYLQTIQKDTLPGGGVRTSRQSGFERAFTYNPRIGISTRYYGMKQFQKGKLRAIRHVVTPTLDFSYTPDFSDASLGYYRTYRDRNGRDVRYSIFEQGNMGGPAPGKNGNIGFSMDNNLELKLAPGKKDTTGDLKKVQLIESIRAGAAWNIYADSLNLSSINISGRTRLFKNISINGSMNVDPYQNVIITQASGARQVVRVNEFQFNRTGSLGTLTNGTLSMSANFNPNVLKSKNAKSKKGYEGELKYMNQNPMDFYDFDVPWSLNVNYSVNYNKYNTLNNPLVTNFSQTLSFNGDVNLTKNWKIGYTSGYDIRNKQLTFTSIDFIRQIHCWEFKLNWIPIGTRQSFLFTINVKSSLLQDLRMTRRRDWWDRQI